MRLIKKHSILNWLYNEAISYPTPTSLSFFWSFGVMALVCLISQIASGIFLAMHYIPSAELAFNSVEHIMRDVRGGWFLRYLHANGASMFFLVVYCHISRGLYYSSFAGKREYTWYSGIIILFLMILTAFLGYVLPWGQMSFWAATVITSLASAIPLIGDFIVSWLWGGFSVGEQTLVRFFSLHYLLPFILFVLVAAHIILLHETGSNTPTGVSLTWGDWITFGPYFFLKDLYFLVFFFIIFMYFVFFNSNYLGHPDNYIPAMYMSTPAHIVPEWYFLPFYALLWSVPDKLGGVLAMLLSIVALAILPIIVNITSKRFLLNSNFVYEWAIFFSIFIANSILLGWIGGQPIEEPMYTIGQYSSIFYFLLIFLIYPVLNFMLSINLTIVKYFTWWEEFYFFILTWVRFLFYLIIDGFEASEAYRLKEERKERDLFLWELHPHFLYDEDYESVKIDPNEKNKDPFYLYVIKPRRDIVTDLFWEESKWFCDWKLMQIDEMITVLQATPESEHLRVEWNKKEIAEMKKYFENSIPKSLKDSFRYFFPKAVTVEKPKNIDIGEFWGSPWNDEMKFNSIDFDKTKLLPKISIIEQIQDSDYAYKKNKLFTVREKLFSEEEMLNSENKTIEEQKKYRTELFLKDFLNEFEKNKKKI